jgi:hypothetical protein
MGARRPAQLWSCVGRILRSHPRVIVVSPRLAACARDANGDTQMSRRNGDRARFQKDRKRKMLHRQRIQELLKALRPQPPENLKSQTISNLKSDQM